MVLIALLLLQPAELSKLKREGNFESCAKTLSASSRDLDAPAWAENEAKLLLDTATGQDRLGVQEMAFRHAIEFDPSDEMLSKMREAAFEYGVGLTAVRDALGVVLRDELFARREAWRS